MGTYNNSIKEIVCKLGAVLDNIEGDFDTETLVKALDKLKAYPHTVDNTCTNDKLDWEEYINTP